MGKSGEMVVPASLSVLWEDKLRSSASKVQGEEEEEEKEEGGGVQGRPDPGRRYVCTYRCSPREEDWESPSPWPPL